MAAEDARARDAAAACGEPAPRLIDRQARAIDYLRVSVTDRCNYRCAYCVPADGVAHDARDGLLSIDEIAALVRIFVGLGVRRVRLTGGEPTVRGDLLALVARLRRLGGLDEIALSTNGHRLPELAAPLRAAGVDRLNVSLDTLDADKFRRISGGGDLARVVAGMDAAAAAGFDGGKLNTVGRAGFNDGEVAALCRFAWARGWVPRFIEEMPMADGRTYEPSASLTADHIRATVAASVAGGRVEADDGGIDRGGGPARYFRLEGPGVPPRRFGIISPMTEHFCASCNRLRLSAAGALHACLGHDDAVDLRRPLRTGDPDDVRAAIRRAVAAKRDGHTFRLIGLGGPRKAMVQIGG